VHHNDEGPLKEIVGFQAKAIEEDHKEGDGELLQPKQDPPDVAPAQVYPVKTEGTSQEAEEKEKYVMK
jgi:hypothetical protein